jgi:hypothetical protein
MNLQDIMKQLEEAGTAQNRKIYTNHGCDIDQYGVSMANLKKILKPIKKDAALGKQLFMSNNADAIYLSQWIVRVEDITIEELEDRIRLSNYYIIIENVIPNIIANDLEWSKEILSKWLHHEEPRFRQSAYNLYANILGIYPDDEFSMDDIKNTLLHIEAHLQEEENRVRYTMNNFVIAVGTYIEELSIFAQEVAQKIGKVQVHMGQTACKVPDAYLYIDKVKQMNRIGQKRKR